METRVCMRCAEEKPLADFKGPRTKRCVSCVTLDHREYSARWRARHRTERNSYMREWNKRPENVERVREGNRKTGAMIRTRQKLLVIGAYGGACACCGETELAFLTMDHIAGDGANHRREVWGVNAGTVYRWLIKQEFPPGFQVLCFNCNCGRQVNGGVCPHEQVVLSLVRESA